MAISFGFQLATQANKRGLYPVVFRITLDRKQKKVRTMYEVEAEIRKSPKTGKNEIISDHWNANPQKPYAHFRKGFTDYAKKNAELFDMVEKYKDAATELQKAGNLTLENLVEKIRKSETSDSFVDYAQKRTDDIRALGNIRNWKKYNGFMNKLKAYLKSKKKKDITFAELTPALLSEFDTFLHQIPNERQPELLLHQNTIQVVFRVFRAIVNRAIDEDKKMLPQDNPFNVFTCSGIPTTKEKLTDDELDRILGLELPKDSLIWNCRNYFFFSFYCAGIRAGDLIQLRWCNITDDGRIRYTMGKNNKPRDIKLIPAALDILKHYRKDDAQPTDYIFPLLDGKAIWSKYVTQEEKNRMPSDMKYNMFTVISAKTALINKELAIIAKRAGIEKKVSTHVARHTFARKAKDEGMDNLMVKDLLGHSSVSITERYMGSFATERTDNAMSEIFKKDEDSKVNDIIKQLQGLSPEKLQMVLAHIQ